MRQITQAQWDDWLNCLAQKKEIDQCTKALAGFVTRTAIKQGRNDIAAIVNFNYGEDHEKSCYSNKETNKIH